MFNFSSVFGGNTSSSDPPAETADFIESPKRKNATTKVLINKGFSSGRMKTGTPPRVDGRSLNFKKMMHATRFCDLEEYRRIRHKEMIEERENLEN